MACTELPLGYIDLDLPVLGGVPAIRTAFGALEEVGYAFYDDRLSQVWVVEMARVRCGLSRDTPMHPDDKRHKKILQILYATRPSALVARFVQRYCDQLRLGRGIEAPPKPVSGSGSETGSESETRKNALRAESHPVEKSPKVSTLAAVVRNDVLPLGISNEGDVIEVAKQAAARHGLAYTGSAIRRAVASARAQVARRGHA